VAHAQCGHGIFQRSFAMFDLWISTRFGRILILAVMLLACLCYVPSADAQYFSSRTVVIANPPLVDPVTAAYLNSLSLQNNLAYSSGVVVSPGAIGYTTGYFGNNFVNPFFVGNRFGYFGAGYGGFGNAAFIGTGYGGFGNAAFVGGGFGGGRFVGGGFGGGRVIVGARGGVVVAGRFRR
jgi:hypothetical protein